MTTNEIIALIGSLATLIAAVATWVQVWKVKDPINQINNAVNHRKPNQKKLIEIIEGVEEEVSELKSDIKFQNKKLEIIDKDLKKHQLFHQLEKEKDITNS